MSTTNGTIATKEQIEATDRSHNDATMELANTQIMELKQQIDKHTARLSKTVSLTVSNTQSVLELLRKTINRDNASETELSVCDNLWRDLQLLANAAREAQKALPDFLTKQDENLRLYHNARVNTTMQELQNEVNLQHKKVNIQ